MSYVVEPQPGIPHNDKEITKSEEVTLKTILTLTNLFQKYDSLKQEVEECKDKANSIVDELIEIDKVHSVNNIPDRITVRYTAATKL